MKDYNNRTTILECCKSRPSFLSWGITITVKDYDCNTIILYRCKPGPPLPSLLVELVGSLSDESFA